MARQIDPNLPVERKSLRKPAKASRPKSPPSENEDLKPSPSSLRLPPLRVASPDPRQIPRPRPKLHWLSDSDRLAKSNSILKEIRAEVKAKSAAKERGMLTLSSDEADVNQPPVTFSADTKPSRPAPSKPSLSTVTLRKLNEADQARLNSVGDLTSKPHPSSEIDISPSLVSSSRPSSARSKTNLTGSSKPVNYSNARSRFSAPNFALSRPPRLDLPNRAQPPQLARSTTHNQTSPGRTRSSS